MHLDRSVLWNHIVVSRLTISFLAAQGVLINAGSIGLSLLIWIFSGMLSMVGALCYAELGTLIPKSGGDYAYIGEAFGPHPAFLYLWSALLMIMPAGNAIISLTFANNILQPFYPQCEPVQNHSHFRNCRLFLFWRAAELLWCQLHKRLLCLLIS